MNKRIYWKKVKQRGPLLWSNVDEPARSAGLLYERDMESGELTTKIVGHMPNTYFLGEDPYTSISALIPCGGKRNPHEFMYMEYDEDEGIVDGWYGTDIDHPLRWMTEKEYLEEL